MTGSKGDPRDQYRGGECAGGRYRHIQTFRWAGGQGLRRAGTEGELYRRRRRRDAVGTELLQELEDFLLLPRISRCCPGESVSVGYGRQKEKHRMKVSKETALKEFQATQQSTFAVSTLLKYWPRNFVVPSSHDRQRNVCPVHDNWPRLIEALHGSGGQYPLLLQGCLCPVPVSRWQ